MEIETCSINVKPQIAIRLKQSGTGDREEHISIKERLPKCR